LADPQRVRSDTFLLPESAWLDVDLGAAMAPLVDLGRAISFVDTFLEFWSSGFVCPGFRPRCGVQAAIWEVLFWVSMDGLGFPGVLDLGLCFLQLGLMLH
jgi:hypothetical protein